MIWAGLTYKEWHQGMSLSLGGDGTVLYLDYGSGQYKSAKTHRTTYQNGQILVSGNLKIKIFNFTLKITFKYSVFVVLSLNH